MNSYLSRKISAVNFISILAVVFWHGTMLPMPSENFRYFYLVQDTFAGALLRFSIPVFFIISGYLFFLKPFNYLNSLKKRLKSIVLPYILWSTLGALFIYSIIWVPQVQSKINLDWQFTILNFIEHITLDPIQYQLWFLRDLYFLVVFSPIIYWSVKKIGYYILIPLLLLWFYTGEASYIIRTESLMFFFSGAAIALCKLDIGTLRMSKTQLLVSFILWIAVSIGIGLIPFLAIKLPFLVISTMLCLVKMLGVLVIWFGYDLFLKRIENAISPILLSSTFFVFCFHEPILTIVEKVSMNIVRTNALIIMSFLNPLIVILISIQVYKIMIRILPKFTRVITGQRSV